MRQSGDGTTRPVRGRRGVGRRLLRELGDLPRLELGLFAAIRDAGRARDRGGRDRDRRRLPARAGPGVARGRPRVRAGRPGRRSGDPRRGRRRRSSSTTPTRSTSAGSSSPPSSRASTTPASTEFFRTGRTIDERPPRFHRAIEAVTVQDIAVFFQEGLADLPDLVTDPEPRRPRPRRRLRRWQVADRRRPAVPGDGARRRRVRAGLGRPGDAPRQRRGPRPADPDRAADDPGHAVPRPVRPRLPPGRAARAAGPGGVAAGVVGRGRARRPARGPRLVPAGRSRPTSRSTPSCSGASRSTSSTRAPGCTRGRASSSSTRAPAVPAPTVDRPPVGRDPVRRRQAGALAGDGTRGRRPRRRSRSTGPGSCSPSSASGGSSSGRCTCPVP